MNKVPIQDNSWFSWMYNWYYTNKKLDFKRDFLVILSLGLLFFPYFIFTLPGSFLEGSFCNRQKRMKVSLSIVGYFLIIVGICMIAPFLTYWDVIPQMTYLSRAVLIGKVWDAFALIGILIMLVRIIIDTLDSLNHIRIKKWSSWIEFRLRPIFRNTVASEILH